MNCTALLRNPSIVKRGHKQSACNSRKRDSSVKKPRSFSSYSDQTFSLISQMPLSNPIIQRQEETTPPSSCPAFVSLTVRPQTPSVDTYRNRCRMGIGSCTTPRGQCGTTGTGAVMQGKIRVSEGCTGELALMQNLLITDRRRTLNNGTRECTISDQALRDGGIPWKGCTITVNSPGEHTITSDDCPNIGLRDNMVAASANDSFKTFLLWKPGRTGSRRPIANATWGWSASARRQQNVEGDCTDQWTISNPSKTDGNGSTSTDQPVISPTAQDLSWEPCSSS